MTWPWEHQLDRIKAHGRLVLEVLLSLHRKVDKVNEHLVATQASLTKLITDVETLTAYYNATKDAAASATDLDDLKAIMDAEDAKVQAVFPTPPTP